MTAPPACAAKRPVSNLNTLSPIFLSTDFGSGCMCLLLRKRAPFFGAAIRWRRGTSPSVLSGKSARVPSNLDENGLATDNRSDRPSPYLLVVLGAGCLLPWSRLSDGGPAWR